MVYGDASVLSDPFSGVNGTLPSLDMWYVHNKNTTVTQILNNKLRFRLNGLYSPEFPDNLGWRRAYIKSLNSIDGDFDVQVDFSVSYTGNNTGIRAAYYYEWAAYFELVSSGDQHAYSLHRSASGGRYSVGSSSNHYSDHEVGCRYYSKVTNNVEFEIRPCGVAQLYNGKFRFVRDGDVLSLYDDFGSGWVLRHVFSRCFTGEFFIRIGLDSPYGWEPYIRHYGNFIVDDDSYVWCSFVGVIFQILVYPDSFLKKRIIF